MSGRLEVVSWTQDLATAFGWGRGSGGRALKAALAAGEPIEQPEPEVRIMSSKTSNETPMRRLAARGSKSRGRPFAKGVSGNPRGRPAGSRNQATVLAMQLLEGEVEALTRKAVELALAGDIPALRLCLERLLPPCKGRLIELGLPAVRSAQQVPAAFAALLAALAGGKVTTEEAQAVASLLEQYRRALETADLEQRVAALEGREAT